MSVTLPVFQPPIGWLNARTPEHAGHVGDLAGVPATDIAVELRRTGEHARHFGSAGQVGGVCGGEVRFAAPVEVVAVVAKVDLPAPLADVGDLQPVTAAGEPPAHQLLDLSGKLIVIVRSPAWSSCGWPGPRR